MNNFKFTTMRRGVLLIIIMLLVPAIKAGAQNPNLEKLNAYKIAFFTRRLNFTSNEAEKFWPVYNEYQKMKTRVQIDKSSIIKNFNQNEKTLSDEQLTELGDKLISAEVQETSLAVEFHNKLKKLLPPAKVIKFYQVENQYKIQLLNELQGSRQQQRVENGRDF